MPCDAVATTSAQVKMEGVLSNEVGKKALIHWMETEFPGVKIKIYGEKSNYITFRWNSYLIYVEPKRIYIQAGFQNGTEIKAVRDKITGFVKDLTGLLTQEKVRAAIAKQSQILSTNRAPNGSLVIKTKV